MGRGAAALLLAAANRSLCCSQNFSAFYCPYSALQALQCYRNKMFSVLKQSIFIQAAHSSLVKLGS